jgi:hypothetical protein
MMMGAVVRAELAAFDRGGFEGYENALYVIIILEGAKLQPESCGFPRTFGM